MKKPWYTFSFISSRQDPEEPTIKTSTLVKRLQPLVEEQNGGLVDITDTRNYVFLCFMMLGIGALMPWNMFITISHDYFTMFKLVDPLIAPNVTTSARSFQNVMTISSQIPNLIFSIGSIFWALKGDLSSRMRTSLGVVLATIVFTIVFIYVDTANWISLFFILTILTVILVNAANGLFQNSLFGLASPFPFKYTNAIIIGQNLCGIIVAVLQMITKTVSDDVQMRALLFFGISSVVIVVCLVLLNVVKRLPFYQRYDASKLVDDSLRSIDESEIWEDIRIAFTRSKSQFANIFFLFFVTLALFPNVCMHIFDQQPGMEYGFLVQEKFYMDVTTFLNFNLFAFIGSLTANWIRVPGPNTIWIAVLCRFWFLIYFPLANYHPAGLSVARNFGVLFDSTWLFVAHVTVLAFSSGYLSSLIMMYAPRAHEDPKIQRVAGMIAAFFLIAGIVAGLLFSWVIKVVVIGFSP